MALVKILKYDIILDDGRAAATYDQVPVINKISVLLFPAQRQYEFKFQCSREGDFEKAKILIDLLRHETNVYYDPKDGRLEVQQEQVGEKDRYPVSRTRRSP